MQPRYAAVRHSEMSALVVTNAATRLSKGFAVKEIPGGCFCRRFSSLVDAARKLTAESRPDVFIAEPVGSGIDLAATVAYPLRQFYGVDFTIAALSLVNPIRALRVICLVRPSTPARSGSSLPVASLPGWPFTIARPASF